MDHEAFEHFLERNEFLLSNILDDVEGHEEAEYVVGCEVFEGLMCVTFGVDGPPDDALNEMWIHAPASVFFAQRILWTGLPEPAPLKDSWLVTIVLPEKEPVFFAKNLEDEMWDPLPSAHAPWFAISTATAMRQATEGKPVPGMISATNEAVFKTPTQHPLPPTNENGVVG